MTTNPSKEQIGPNQVILRGKLWDIVDIDWLPAEPDVGIMADYPNGFELEDANGNRWDWDKDQLTAEEEETVDDVLSKLERDYDEPEDWV